MDKHHFATIKPAKRHSIARLERATIASSQAALELTEQFETKLFDPVVYFPLADCETRYFSDSSTHTFCRIKGQASYYHITLDGKEYKDAAWYYPEPLAQVEQIRAYVAFSPKLLSVSS
ncbi:MAG: DUF427 domain-containing protein [Halioglobus sp.]